MSRIAITIVLAASLLGGCLGGATEDDDAQPASVAQNATNTGADAIAANASATAANMTGMVAVQYSGTTAQGACTTTGTPADQCQFTDPGKESFRKITYAGKAKHFRATITYGAQQPGFEMYWTLCVGKPGETGVNCSNYKTAASPAQLDVDLSSVPLGAPLALSIGSVAGPGPGAILFASSEFKVDGHLMTETVAADPMAGMQM